MKQDFLDTIQKNSKKALIRRFHGWVKNPDGTIIINIAGYHKYVFNNLAGHFWELIDESNTFDDILNIIKTQFVPYDNSLEQEIISILWMLVKYDLVNWEQSIWDEDE